MPNLDFDPKSAHKYFAATCFNRAWDLIDKTNRTPDEDEQMLLLSMASYYHWTQRDDFTTKARSVACWQLSRVYALLGQANNARHYGELCLAASQEPDIPPFYLGYAYEALARAEAAAGNARLRHHYLEKAHETADQIPEPEAKQMLLDDLNTIK